MKRIIKTIAVLLVIGIMLGLAEILNEKEIIFPEIAAIAVGAIAAPRRTWRTSDLRIFINITVCALAGLLIVLFAPFPVWIQLSLAYGISQIYYLYSRTSFAPMVSAITLPVLLQTKSIVYLYAAIGLTTMILLIRKALILANVTPKEDFTPLSYPDRSKLTLGLIRWLIVSAMVYLALHVWGTYMVAPPLLVAFTEFAKTKSNIVKTPIKAVLLLSFSAAVGSFSRLIIVGTLELPLTVAGLLAIFLVLIVLNITKMYLPPAGALSILSMLIPEENILVFPLHVLIGAAVYMLVAKIINEVTK